MFYKFRSRRVAKPYLEKTAVNEKPDDPDNEIGIIQGQTPDSLQEWWTSRALDRLKIPYTYQYPINGGRARGGYLVDFVVNTVPLATMIEIEGNHWHTGELGADDKKRQADVEEAMRDFCKTPIFILWVPDLINVDTIFQKLKAELA